MNDIEYLRKYYSGNIDDAIKRLELITIHKIE